LKQTTIHFGNGQLGKQDVLASRQERYGWGCTWFWIDLSRQCLSNLFKAFRNIWCCLLFPYPCKISLLKPFCHFKYDALRWDIPWPNHFIILSICRLRYIFLFLKKFYWLGMHFEIVNKISTSQMFSEKLENIFPTLATPFSYSLNWVTHVLYVKFLTET
jgi:hypothetical protein